MSGAARGVGARQQLYKGMGGQVDKSDVAIRAICWINDHLDLFSPLTNERTVELGKVKCFAELAFLCGIVNRLAPARVKMELGPARDFIEDVAYAPVLLHRFLRQPALFLLYGNIYLALEAWTTREIVWRAPVQSLIDLGYLGSQELAPFRRIDLRNLLDSAGYRHSLPSRIELFENTLTFHEPPVVYLTNDDVYSVTLDPYSICLTSDAVNSGQSFGVL